MQNKTITLGLAILGVGIGIGAGIGYGLGVKMLKEQYQEDAADVKDFYMNKLQEMGVMDKDFTPEEMIDQIIEVGEDDEDDEDERETEEYFNQIKGYSTAVAGNAGNEGLRGKGKPLIKYNNPPLILEPREELYDGPEPPEEEIDEEYEAELDARAEEFAMRKYENKSNGLPYVIDQQEYEDGPEEYERIVLYYYSVDRMLCEDDDTRVEEEEELVGLDYEDVLEMQTTAWVRNDTLLNLYEIHALPYSYMETVANAMETPKEREYRIVGRRKEGMDN